MNDPESQDIDNDNDYQEEYVKFDPAVSLQHLTCEMEWLRQTVEDKDNNPRDSAKHPRNTFYISEQSLKNSNQQTFP